MESGLSSLLGFILLWTCVCVGFCFNSPRVRTINSVSSYQGQTLEIQCKDDENEEVLCRWQTPFGFFEGCKHHIKDPAETCNSSLRISKVTSSHDGLYLCVRQDKTGRTILPYRVHVLNSNLKKIREAEVYDTTVSDGHFIAAVTSSVIVTFLVAFTLGAFTRSYVIKCLQMTRVHIVCKIGRHNENNPGPTANNTEPAQFERAHFYISQDSGEDTVDVMGIPGDEDSIQDSERKGDIDAAANVIANDRNEESNKLQSGEDQNQEFKTELSPHPKKKTRVIKVYNYDEEGNQYGHIKDGEPEGEDKAKERVRTKSLTRLNTIMKQAESVDFNPVEESTDSVSTT